jgi:peptidoglycan/LPS O-acetylase OafA/YrhL
MRARVSGRRGAYGVGRRPQSPLLLAGAWVGCLALLCATSMAGYFVYHEEFNGFSGEVTRVCNWQRWFDLVFSTCFRTGWSLGVAALVWLGLTSADKPRVALDWTSDQPRGVAPPGRWPSQGGPVTAFLGASAWTPVARLTFGVYLTHIMVVRLLYGSVAKRFDYTDYLGIYLLTANYCLALLAALALYMLVEKPCTNLVMLCLAPPRRPSGQERGGA